MRTLPLTDGRKLNLGDRTRVMGILNVTPDSFFPGSRQSSEDVLSAARDMAAAGADILDIGGESTRPGSLPVAEEEELARVVPAVRLIRSHLDIPISIDTRKASVARAALDAGADIVNDISALRDDPELGAVVASYGVPVILMHIRGVPKTMQADISYDDTVGEIAAELLSRVDAARAYGIPDERMFLDPGIGFGKRLEDNLRILGELPRLSRMGFPLVIGASRKGFIGAVLGSVEGPRPVERRLSGSLAVAAYAAVRGVEIIRVHDVEETVDVVRMIDAISGISQGAMRELAQ